MLNSNKIQKPVVRSLYARVTKKIFRLGDRVVNFMEIYSLILLYNAELGPGITFHILIPVYDVTSCLLSGVCHFFIGPRSSVCIHTLTPS